ncbi:Holliday junction resolvase RuvX [soil metagenome]
MRYLCIDLGDKRTGLALGDPEMRMASPLEVLEVPVTHDAGKALLAALVKAARESGATALVVGLPLNMNGTEGPRAKMVREWGARIGAATSLPVHYQDERLSTAAADWQMARTGMTRGEKKARRDAIAAAGILKEFLDGLTRGNQEV